MVFFFFNQLIEINGIPRIKLSEDFEKVTIPGRKKVYRLDGSSGNSLLDLMTKNEEPEPSINVKILCRHPFFESKRAFVQPSKVELRHKKYWFNGKVIFLCENFNDSLIVILFIYLFFQI